MNKAVYIGAGLDILPIIVLSEIREFIFIDSLPTCQYGTFCYGDKDYYSESFLDDLNKIMNNNEFRPVGSKESYLEFKQDSSDRILKYFINTAFPEHLTGELISEINTCDTLIIAGFCPHKVILELMPKLKYVIGDQHTCYTSISYEDEEAKHNSVCNYLIENPEICKNYVQIHEKEKFEYWNMDALIPSIKANHTLVSCKNLVEFEKHLAGY